MAHAIIDDVLWKEMARLLQKLGAGRPRTGRPRLDDRAVLSGILLVLRTGMAWEDLPSELGFGSGMTCLRRLREWQAGGAWLAMRDLLLRRLPRGDRVPWWRAEVGGGVARTILQRRLHSRREAPPLLHLVHPAVPMKGADDAPPRNDTPVASADLAAAAPGDAS
jgi:transposase